MAAIKGNTPVVALLLATPGVDPLARTRVRGVQTQRRGCLSHGAAPMLLFYSMAILHWTGRGGTKQPALPRYCRQIRASQRLSQQHQRDAAAHEAGKQALRAPATSHVTSLRRSTASLHFCSRFWLTRWPCRGRCMERCRPSRGSEAASTSAFCWTKGEGNQRLSAQVSDARASDGESSCLSLTVSPCARAVSSSLAAIEKACPPYPPIPLKLNHASVCVHTSADKMRRHAP